MSSNDSSNIESGSIELPEQLAVGREKRSTAGNRMRALLEREIEKDELFEEVENDVDFEEAKDEHDIIDSDFDQDSPDEATYEDGDDVEERAIEAQEKADKKASRAKTGPAALKRSFGLPKARPPPSTQATTTTSSSSELPTSRRTIKRISFAPQGSTKRKTSDSSRVRTSSRKSTVKVKLETQTKLKAEEDRKAALPVRERRKKKPRLTQDALIAEALEMEEINRENLKWFLEQEEEKKAKLRNVGGNKIVGPFLRWQSVGYDKLGYKLGEINDDDHFDDYGNLIEPEIQPAAAAGGSTSDLTSTSASALPSTSNQISTISSNEATLDPVFAARAETSAQKAAALEVIPSNAAIAAKAREGATARAYVSIHDLPEDSTWVDEFTAFLGDHCSWDAIPVVPTRNRPLRPKRSICPITGLPAVYKDPRSGIPYANKEAYETLTDLLDNKFIWTGSGGSGESSGAVVLGGGGEGESSSSHWKLGAYVGKEDDNGAGNVLKKARLDVIQSQTSQNQNRRDVYSNPRSGSSSNEVLNSTLPPHLQVSDPEAPLPLTRVGPAPGDESVLLQAALSLPEGSSRSGARRGV